MKLPKTKYISLVVAAISFIYFAVCECSHTYRIEQQGGWWRNYIAKCKDGYTGTYDDFIRALYIGDLTESLIFSMLVFIVSITIISLFRHFLSKIITKPSDTLI